MQFIQSDKYGIARGGQIAGQTIAAMPGLIAQKKEQEYVQEQRRLGIEAAEKDWGSMDTAYKAIKNQYAQAATPLLESGKMTQEEFNSNVRLLRGPTQADKKNPGSYIDSLGQNYGTLIGDVKQRIQRGETTGAVTTAMEGRPAGIGGTAETTTTGVQQPIPVQEPVGMGAPQPAGRGGFTEEDITSRTLTGAPGAPTPAVPGAQYREDVAAVAGKQGITEAQLMEDPRYANMQTRAEAKKQEDLAEYRRKMVAKGYRDDQVDNALKELDFLIKIRNDDSREE